MSGSEELKLNGDSVITARLFGPVLVGLVLFGTVLNVFHPAVNGPSFIILDQGRENCPDGDQPGPVRSSLVVAASCWGLCKSGEPESGPTRIQLVLD